jgi:hypothetical protein
MRAIRPILQAEWIRSEAMDVEPELRDQLIECARVLASDRGWPWREPVEVTAGAEGGEPVWFVNSNYLMRGANVRIVLRRSDHSLVRAGFLPR